MARSKPAKFGWWRSLRPTVFISYRRSDAGGYAGQLYEKLERHYGDRALYLDHQDNEVGGRWEKRLTGALDRASAVLVVIGPDWLTTGDDGRRIDMPSDWVRREVEAGLAAEKRLIPVLVGGARMPRADELPSSIAGLRSFQGIEVRPATVDPDTKRLIREIGGWRWRLLGLPIYLWPLMLLVVLSGVAVALATGSPNAPPTAPRLDVVRTTEDTAVEVDLLAGAVDDRSDRLTLEVDPVSQAGGGVSLVGPDTALYRPPPGFSGDDRFSYRVVDGDGASTTQTLFITVAIGPMKGDFNVAVAGFLALEDQTLMASSEADLLAADVYERISSELETLNETDGFNFEVRAPEQTGKLSGLTRVERARSAMTLAGDIEADVLVYGTVTGDAIAPEFFVQNRANNLQGAEEITGDYELGSKIFSSPVGAGSLTENAQARLALVARMEALTQFVIGLSWYSTRQYDKARSVFEEANAPAWLDTDGKEVLHLFQGNSAGKVGDYDAAASAYERALELNGGYARALVGQAEIEFFRAAVVERAGNCEAGEVDETGIRSSERIYRTALAAPDQPAVSNIDAKVAFGLGRVYSCMSQALIEDRWADAVSEFDSVIASYNGGREDLRDLAAESWAGKGLASFPFVDQPNRGEAFCAVAAAYQNAIDLTTLPEREALFLDQRNFAVQQARESGVSCD